MRNVQQSLFMRALRREPVVRTPAWLMRQAGRYLPEYRALRAKAGDFMTLCKTPELALEVALQPLQRFPLDAAILFSDILTIPDALGLGLHFVEGEGPRFKYPLTSKDKIESVIKKGQVSSLDYVTEAVSLIASHLPKEMPLIGFSGSPWTLACYMIEGGSSATFSRIMSMIKEEKEPLLLLLDFLSSEIVSYLSSQIKKGADALMLFDTWGGLLPDAQFHQYSLHFSAKIRKELKEMHPEIPLILFVKGGGKWLSSMAEAGFDVLSVDETIDLSEARQKVGDKVALQGNLAPSTLLKTPNEISEAVKRMLAQFGHGSGHIFNLSHGVTPDVPPENVRILLDAVAEMSPFYHK